MKRLGAHVSAAGGVENSPLNAMEIKAKAFALFTKNQRRWDTKALSEKSIKNFKENIKKANIDVKYILPHDSYLINLGNPDIEKNEKSYLAFLDEIKRCEQLGLIYLNIHPGSHLNQINETESMKLIIKNLNKALSESNSLSIVLENTAGQGSNLAYSFEQIAYMIDRVEDKSRIGVCLDTCHLFAAGYDLRTKDAYEKTMSDFENIVGFKYLKAVHLNDAKSNLGSNLDRHHSIGEGTLGMDFFTFIMNDDRFEEIPMILETIKSEIWKEEIELLYSLVK